MLAAKSTADSSTSNGHQFAAQDIFRRAAAIFDTSVLDDQAQPDASSKSPANSQHKDSQPHRNAQSKPALPQAASLFDASPFASPRQPSSAREPPGNAAKPFAANGSTAFEPQGFKFTRGLAGAVSPRGQAFRALNSNLVGRNMDIDCPPGVKPFAKKGVDDRIKKNAPDSSMSAPLQATNPLPTRRPIFAQAQTGQAHWQAKKPTGPAEGSPGKTGKGPISMAPGMASHTADRPPAAASAMPALVKNGTRSGRSQNGGSATGLQAVKTNAKAAPRQMVFSTGAFIFRQYSWTRSALFMQMRL